LSLYWNLQIWWLLFYYILTGLSKMLKVTIDKREVEVDPGTTILGAANKLGIHIPALCFNKDYQPSTSCMVCVVKANNRIIPSCASIAEDGMVIESETEEIHEARRTALELLLSDHLGDCMAPCQRTCPAGMNIPLMIRQIAANKLLDAFITVINHIPMPSVLGRICPAPCENACRRGSHDDPVSICLLKRYVGDVDLAQESPYIPPRKSGNGKRIAIIGSGPTGLTAAYYLLQGGYNCVLFDNHEEPGGMLRYGVSKDKLPAKVLDGEIQRVKDLGAEFILKTKIEKITDLQKDYDAVLVASGDNGLVKEMNIDRNTLCTNFPGIFAGGNATGRKSKLAVRSVADGKTVAISISQFVTGIPVTGQRKPFTVSIGKLAEGEIHGFLACVSEKGRITSSSDGFSDSEANLESNRCLHCDCRKADHCKLRDYSGLYNASPNRYKAERKLFESQIQHPDLVYEPGKCIKCGICIQIAARYSEPLGLTFIGRGFDVKVGVPFNRTIMEGLEKAAKECVETCPTGALAFK
jgi:ferredoxin